MTKTFTFHIHESIQKLQPIQLHVVVNVSLFEELHQELSIIHGCGVQVGFLDLILDVSTDRGSE